MSNSKDLLEEYFNPDTLVERKREIERIIQDAKDEDASILIDLKSSLDLSEEIEIFRGQLHKLEEKKPFVNYYSVAASVTLIAICCITIFLFLNDSASPNAVFEEYYRPYDGYVITRALTKDAHSEGITAYETGDYATALKHFLNAKSDSLRISERNLLISSCYLSLDEPASALRYLSKIRSQQIMIQYNKDWYLALAYLNSGRVTESGKLFMDIGQSNSPFALKAKEILKKHIFAP